MSLVHQKLYQTANLSDTDMATYISELVAYLESSFDVGKRIRFVLRVEHIQLGLTHSIPLGLILNEAITNAIKYGFPDGRHGEITVRLQRAKGNQILLSVEDNGVGVSLDGKKQLTGSMGMSLMKGLSDDIGGHFTIENDHGTKVKVSFPPSPQPD
jgi:two-component system, sensor histidine kinase PdtaS